MLGQGTSLARNSSTESLCHMELSFHDSSLFCDISSNQDLYLLFYLLPHRHLAWRFIVCLAHLRNLNSTGGIFFIWSGDSRCLTSRYKLNQHNQKNPSCVRGVCGWHRSTRPSERMLLSPHTLFFTTEPTLLNLNLSQLTINEIIQNIQILMMAIIKFKRQKGWQLQQHYLHASCSSSVRHTHCWGRGIQCGPSIIINPWNRPLIWPRTHSCTHYYKN